MASKQHSLLAAKILSDKPTKKYRRAMRLKDNGPTGRLDYWEHRADRDSSVVLSPQSSLGLVTNEFLGEGFSFSNRPR